MESLQEESKQLVLKDLLLSSKACPEVALAWLLPWPLEEGEGCCPRPQSAGKGPGR